MYASPSPLLSADSAAWPTQLTWLQGATGGAIGVAFLAIAAALLYIHLLVQGRSRGERILLLLFILFIAGAGASRLAALFSASLYLQGIEEALSAVTALFALTTAIVVWRLVPELLRLPSRDRLQREIVAHLRTCEGLKAARAELEERVEERAHELAQAKQRFEIALRGSPISVFSQDKDMRFVWAHNLPPGLASEGLIGKTDADIFPAEAAGPILAAKRHAMETGESQELDVDFELFGRWRSYFLLIEALRDDQNAVAGSTTVAVDVTERKASEHQLRLLLRELTHRSKNLLAVIQAIARQTALRTRSVDDFLHQFSNRLIAISCSHDLLVADDWRGASLRTLIEQQLLAHADHRRERIVVDGEEVVLKPEAIHNLGLVLHELASNARQYGALSSEAGQVAIRWAFDGDGSTLELVWEEAGGPPVIAPKRSGFGRAMIERVMGEALSSAVKLTFAAEGVRCVIAIPAHHVASRPGPKAAA
jgi:two-component sensor histidine kinase/PAS domain-containing protein